ncbi:MAG: GAF domain-containing protein, partial [Chloroflexota bacterium]
MAEEGVEITIEKTQTLDTMLHLILNQALVAIGAEAGSLMLVDNRQGILQIKARLGKPRPGRKTERVFKIDDKSVGGWVVQNRRSYLCPDVEQDPFFSPSRSGKNFLSLLSVPIIYEGEVLAIINADAEEKGYFTEWHQVRLESVARQVASPIAERISILDALAEVGVELTRLPREGGVEPVLQKIAQLAVRSLGADVVTLYQYIQEKDEFPVEGTGPTIGGTIGDKNPMRRKVFPGDVPWTVVKERKSGFYADVHEQGFLTRDIQRPGDKPRQRFIKREGIQSMAALLLPYRAAELRDEEVVGVMFVNYRTRHQFSSDEISALATFADYAAVAILNARLEEQRRAERIRMVESIAANFAHRMSNLAGTSRVATQLLRSRINPTDVRAQRQLDRIESEARVLLELAERLARPFQETGSMLELAPIDIEPILEAELERVRFAPGQVNLIKELGPDLPKVQSVQFQLQQVLHDIINNALEAMENQEQGKLVVRVRFNKSTSRIEVEIQDSGPGIPREIRDKLFAPGVTTKEHKLGIGLWWCQTFMQATGGNVNLKDTRLGEGTTFVIEVP